MKRSLLFLVFFLLGSPQASTAFPRLIAKKILERSDYSYDEFEVMNEFAEAVIKGAEEIQVHEIKVGNPPVSLNVLVVNPRDYGFKVYGGVVKNKEFSFGIKALNMEGSAEEMMKSVLSSERRKEYEQSREIEVTQAEAFKAFEYLARQGDQNAVPEKSKTIFFLNGFGVSNRVSVAWALILAKNGYQVIAPDLRGFANSGGSGPTYGKHEVEDLTQLLTKLQQSGLVKGKSVGVIGISYGAAMASLWTAKDLRVEATVLIAPYAQVDKTIMKAAESFRGDLKFNFLVTPKSIRKGTEIVERKLGVTWEAISPAKAIPTIRHPILFITSSGDSLIPPADVKKLYETAPEGSFFKSYKGLPHEIVGYNVDDAGPLILDWLENNFP